MFFSDDADGFVNLAEAVPDVLLDIRYYSTYNFIGDRIDGYEEPVALLAREAAFALETVSAEALKLGFRLKIFDAYRPQMAVDHFMRWAANPSDTRMKRYFYPELQKEKVIPQGYIMERSGHSRGSAVDLTLFDMTAQKDLDMGGPFDFFGTISHPDCREISRVQFENRMLLRNLMISHGFSPLSTEWWHFTLEKEPWPDTYFTFPVSGSSVCSVH